MYKPVSRTVINTKHIFEYNIHMFIGLNVNKKYSMDAGQRRKASSQ